MWEKFAASHESLGAETFVDRETIGLIDYFIQYIRDDDPSWRNLYVGERLKQLHWPPDSLDEIIERRERVFTADRDALLKLLSQDLALGQLDELASRFDELRELVTAGARSSKEVSILLVGDCLFLDVSTFLASPLLDRGITLRPVFVTSKNPVELRNTLRGLAAQKFDLVCYSPYTYEFSVLFAQTHYLAGALSGPRSLRRLAREAHLQIAPTIHLLSGQFDCTVFVHTTANIRRHASTLGSYAKNLVTLAARKIAAKEANALLTQEITELNAVTRNPVVLINELSLVAKYGELELAKKFYDSEPVHPTRMSQRLSETYIDIISSVKNLLGKKVVVLDLDNTVWHGLIGEGSVQNDYRRQRVLQILRQKGILLAIASKNDPRNVHWRGALLQENDFVASQINWDPKPANIKRIAGVLNLKLKDFVFIDDRSDELEMARLACPGIHCMDAASKSTWQTLDWWAKALPSPTEADRTQMYLERKLRQQHLDETAGNESQQELLATLGLCVEIRPAEQKDLFRAVELINRTSQFNTCGTRVSNQAFAAWNDSARHHILVAEASDKFGGMGIISVMVLEEAGNTLNIAVWVLSCRVFGFGIETAILNQVQRIADRLEIPNLRGLLVETPNNQPCRNVYASNGFVSNGKDWELQVSEIPPDPAWLSITVLESPALTKRLG
jgi:FkbH-like protein